ncbi:MAG: hypothetical protein ACYC5M_11705 [Anaerolineae bacterium]
MWHLNGGLDAAAIRYSLAFYQETGGLAPDLGEDEAADLSYLTKALQELGRR